MPRKGVRHAKFAPIDVVRDYCRRFPAANHAALARKITGEHPALFPNLQACDTSIRRARGKQGQHSRVASNDTTLHETEVRSSIPEGRRQLPDWKTIQHDETGWWLVMSDIHIPWHDHEAILALVKEAKKRRIVGILLNGDVVDFYNLSDHEKDPRLRLFKEEVETARQFIQWLRKQFPRAVIVWKIGNHEERYERYMLRKAPELLDLDDFSWETICRCREQGVEMVGDCQPVSLGKLMTIHGHEYRFAISNPVSASRGLFLRAGVSSLAGHWHRPSHFSKRDLSGHIVSTWSTGCLCDLRPKWLPINEWGSGAAFVNVGPTGSFEVENYRIIDGRLWK